MLRSIKDAAAIRVAGHTGQALAYGPAAGVSIAQQNKARYGQRCRTVLRCPRLIRKPPLPL